MGLSDLKEEEEQSEEEPEDAEVVDVTPAPQAERENVLLMPVEDIDKVAELYDQFEEIKEKLLKKEDTTAIGSNIHVNKSGWRKIATAFNLSVEVTDTEIWEENGIVKARATARATAPNGKVSTEVAMCASNESNHMDSGNPKKLSTDELSERDDYFHIDGKWRRLKDPKEVNEHNILATAATRAKNRAISDCVGGGEVSAEEITKEDVFGE